MDDNIEHQAFWEALKRISKIKEDFNINTDCKECGQPLIKCNCAAKTVDFLTKKIRKKKG